MLIHRDDVQNRIQQRVGYSLAAGAFFIAVINFSSGLFRKEAFITVILDPRILFLLPISILAFITAIKDCKLLKFIQVLLFFGMGVTAVIINPPGSLTGVAFFCYALILSLQYDFLRKHLRIKIIGILVLFSAVLILSAALREDYVPTAGIATIFFTLVFLYLIWIAFAEEIKAYARKNIELEREIEKNRVFVNFGRSVSGIVHNLRNKMMAIDGYNRLLEKTAGEDEKEYLGNQKAVSAEVTELVDNLMFAVRSRQEYTQQVVSLKRLIKGVAALFNSNEKFKSCVQVRLDLRDEGLISASPLEISQMLENIIRNAWEAMEDAAGYLLTIKMYRREDTIILEITDQGHGIPVCFNCNKNKCLGCREFRIGRSDKKEGTGIGMVFTQETLKKMNGNLHIQSRKHGGTVVEIFFPSDERELSEKYRCQTEVFDKPDVSVR